MSVYVHTSPTGFHEGQRPTVLLAVPGYAQVDGVDPKSVLASPRTQISGRMTMERMF